jgi:hypothetical protein
MSAPQPALISFQERYKAFYGLAPMFWIYPHEKGALVRVALYVTFYIDDKKFDKKFTSWAETEELAIANVCRRADKSPLAWQKWKKRKR